MIDRTTGRWRFARDDDSHNYLIPAEKEAAFDHWLEHERGLWGEIHTDEEFEALKAKYTGEDFNDYRINSHEAWTFTDPQED